jgi:hypothetical protein
MERRVRCSTGTDVRTALVPNPLLLAPLLPGAAPIHSFPGRHASGKPTSAACRSAPQWKAGANGYKDARMQLAVCEEHVRTTLQLEPSANFTKVIIRVVDRKDQKYVNGANVTLERETKQGAETAFVVVEAQPASYRVTAPGYRDCTGSVQAGRAKEQAEQIVYVHLERLPQGRIGTGMRD